MMKLDDIGFVDAVRELARRAGIQITEAPGAAMNRGKKARLKGVQRLCRILPHPAYARAWPEGRRGPLLFGGA